MNRAIRWAEHVVLVGGALGLAVVFTFALGTYYRSIHAGAGPAFAAHTGGPPVAFVIALLAGYGGRWLAGRSGRRRLLWAFAAMVLIVGALFAAEWIRTSDDRARDRLAVVRASPNDGLKL